MYNNDLHLHLPPDSMNRIPILCNEPLPNRTSWDDDPGTRIRVKDLLLGTGCWDEPEGRAGNGRQGKSCRYSVWRSKTMRLF